MNDTISGPDFEAIRQSTRASQADRPIPITVEFDRVSGRIVVDFANGAAFAFLARSLQGLGDASDENIANVELEGVDGLHWPSLDADFTISGLMRGVFGTSAFVESQRKGGRSRSEKKTAASRANGAKGGRPLGVRKS
jgi:hypothetical protein